MVKRRSGLVGETCLGWPSREAGLGNKAHLGHSMALALADVELVSRGDTELVQWHRACHLIKLRGGMGHHSTRVCMQIPVAAAVVRCSGVRAHTRIVRFFNVACRRTHIVRGCRVVTVCTKWRGVIRVGVHLGVRRHVRSWCVRIAVRQRQGPQRWRALRRCKARGGCILARPQREVRLMAMCAVLVHGAMGQLVVRTPRGCSLRTIALSPRVAAMHRWLVALHIVLARLQGASAVARRRRH